MQNVSIEGGRAEDTVADDEMLYRRVPRNNPPRNFYDRAGGRLQVLGQSFSEPPVEEGKPFAGQYRLSVDRARLRGFSPELTRGWTPEGDPAPYAVVQLLAGEARSAEGVAEVVPDPIRAAPDEEDNPAHALICVAYNPAQTRNARERHFRVVCQDLADLANRRPWPIEPPDG